MFKPRLTHAGFYVVQTLCSVATVIKFAQNPSLSKNHKVPLKFKSTEVQAPVSMNGKSFSHP